jgi:hypothetical protein
VADAGAAGDEQGGVRTERLWFNSIPDRVHWARGAGKDLTDRQRIKRKAETWARRYQAVPRGAARGAGAPDGGGS